MEENKVEQSAEVTEPTTEVEEVKVEKKYTQDQVAEMVKSTIVWRS